MSTEITPTEEVFVIIKGYENYSISTHGRVRRETPGINTVPGQFKNIQLNKKTGYTHCKVSGSEGKKSVAVHRLVAETFIPNPNNYREVDHIDRDKTNNHVDNLRWVTRWENMANLGTHRSMKSILAFPPGSESPLTFECVGHAARVISRLTGLTYHASGICNVLIKPNYTHYKGWKFTYASTEN
jgi:hypothetical protein